jgi:hypothetical protein
MLPGHRGNLESLVWLWERGPIRDLGCVLDSVSRLADLKVDPYSSRFYISIARVFSFLKRSSFTPLVQVASSSPYTHNGGQQKLHLH